MSLFTYPYGMVLLDGESLDCARKVAVARFVGAGKGWRIKLYGASFIDAMTRDHTAVVSSRQAVANLATVRSKKDAKKLMEDLKNAGKQR